MPLITSTPLFFISQDKFTHEAVVVCWWWYSFPRKVKTMHSLSVVPCSSLSPPGRGRRNGRPVAGVSAVSPGGSPTFSRPRWETEPWPRTRPPPPPSPPPSYLPPPAVPAHLLHFSATQFHTLVSKPTLITHIVAQYDERPTTNSRWMNGKISR